MSKMKVQETDLEQLVRELKEVNEQIEAVQGLFDKEDELRAQIRELLVENHTTHASVHGIKLTIGTRKHTTIVDPDQIRRTLLYRGILEDCLTFDVTKVRKALGDEALGLMTTEQKYLIVKGTS